jgi:hypothetical protein
MQINQYIYIYTIVISVCYHSVVTVLLYTIVCLSCCAIKKNLIIKQIFLNGYFYFQLFS